MPDGFLNVYNFIPFPETGRKSYTDKQEDEKLSGVIHYTITPKTPVFIPNTSNTTAFRVSNQFQEHNSYDFFSYTDLNDQHSHDTDFYEPVIPGSEIRGVIRSIYETLTDSCMSSLNDEEVALSKRVPEPFVPGLIHRTSDNTFELLEASSIEFHNGNATTYTTPSYSEGQQVFIDSASKTEIRPGLEKIEAANVSRTASGRMTTPGYFIKGEDPLIDTIHKKYAHIFVQKSHGSSRTISSMDLKALGRVIEISKKQTGNTTRYSEYGNNLRSFINNVEKQYFPVYYSTVTDTDDDTWKKIYLSPACVTREVYNTSIKELSGVFKPCSGRNKCPACALFGRVDSNRIEKNNITSRIRFSDARLEKIPNDFSTCYYDNGTPVTLEILSNPKLGNTEFYLTKPEDGKFWTYDYYVDDNGKIHVEDATLRGRKNYWHQPKSRVEILQGQDISKDKQNRTVRLLDKGEKNTFKGCLYFDGITKPQLEQLLWIMNNGSEEDKEKNLDLCYKIGGGKPLGLGSIKCKVTEYTIRSVEFNASNSTLIYKEQTLKPTISKLDDIEDFTESESVKNALKFMLSFNTVPEQGVLVSYPVIRDPGNSPLADGYEWPTKKNREMRPFAKRSKITIYRGLPEVQNGVNNDEQGEVKFDVNQLILPFEPEREATDTSSDRNGAQGQRSDTPKRKDSASIKYTDPGWKDTKATTFSLGKKYTATVLNADQKTQKMKVSIDGKEVTMSWKDVDRNLTKKPKDFVKKYCAGAQFEVTCGISNGQTTFTRK
ncbi:MAG: TIGR03986 family CRISPR-associated RAMP protein [Clostridiales bacterium]|nr:TIGR03986 family CRISPR-associated RAMP protein [Clostridiales bacterium]